MLRALAPPREIKSPHEAQTDRRRLSGRRANWHSSQRRGICAVQADEAVAGNTEAIEAIARRWKLLPHRIAFAGLKDKHALTTQYVTIRGGERRGLSQANIELQYAGQAEPDSCQRHRGEPLHSRVAGLGGQRAGANPRKITMATKDGVPNYFDNQRFGSLGESGEFIARPWCLGDYERAVWLALADANVHDRPDDRDPSASFASSGATGRPSCRG